MPSVPANGIRIEYESFGEAEAPAIVLIMGLAMQLNGWPDPRDRRAIVDQSVRVWNALASPGFPTDPSELRERVERSVARSYHPQGVARQLVAVLASGDRSKDLARIRMPTLVLHGDCDPLVRSACGEDTAQKIPGARLRIIRGMAHDMAAWQVLADEIVAHARSVPQ